MKKNFQKIFEIFFCSKWLKFARNRKKILGIVIYCCRFCRICCCIHEFNSKYDKNDSNGYSIYHLIFNFSKIAISLNQNIEQNSILFWKIFLPKYYYVGNTYWDNLLQSYFCRAWEAKFWVWEKVDWHPRQKSRITVIHG